MLYSLLYTVFGIQFLPLYLLYIYSSASIYIVNPLQFVLFSSRHCLSYYTEITFTIMIINLSSSFIVMFIHFLSSCSHILLLINHQYPLHIFFFVLARIRRPPTKPRLQTDLSCAFSLFIPNCAYTLHSSQNLFIQLSPVTTNTECALSSFSPNKLIIMILLLFAKKIWLKLFAVFSKIQFYILITNVYTICSICYKHI